MGQRGGEFSSLNLTNCVTDNVTPTVTEQGTCLKHEQMTKLKIKIKNQNGDIRGNAVRALRE